MSFNITKNIGRFKLELSLLLLLLILKSRQAVGHPKCYLFDKSPKQVTAAQNQVQGKKKQVLESQIKSMLDVKFLLHNQESLCKSILFLK